MTSDYVYLCNKSKINITKHLFKKYINKYISLFYIFLRYKTFFIDI